MTESEYNNCLIIKKELRDRMYKVKLQLAFMSALENKSLLEEKYQTIRKEYLKNLNKINEFEKENEQYAKHKRK